MTEVQNIGYSLTEEDWEFIKQKYQKLISYIAKGVFGDTASNSFEDTVNDLYLYCVKAVNGYTSKTGLEFKEFKDTDQFNAYIKTCLWNRRNTKRKYIALRQLIRANEVRFKTTLSPGDNIYDENADNFSSNFENNIADTRLRGSDTVDMIDSFVSLSDLQKTIVTFIIKNPKSFLDNGKINCNHVVKKLNITPPALNLELYEIGQKLSREFI
jgi:hypothetical protein